MPSNDSLADGYANPSSRRAASDGEFCLAVGETVILLRSPLPLVGVSIGMERGCQQNDSVSPPARSARALPCEFCTK